MMHDYELSSKRFLRLVAYTMFASILVVLLLALIFPAPLLEQANRALVPNPAKSAWFLLWIQELVSYRLWFIYPILATMTLICGLPWLLRQPVSSAVWFGSPQRPFALFILFLVLCMVVLTVIAAWFRGMNWALVFPCF